MTNTNDNKVGSACMCSTLTTTSVLSKFTALQIFQDALLQRQSFVDGGNDGDDRKEGVGGWKRGKGKAKGAYSENGISSTPLLPFF